MLLVEVKDLVQQAQITGLEEILITQEKQICELQSTIMEKEKQLQDISKLLWRKGKSAPSFMCRGAAVVHGDTAYIRPAGTNMLYSYKNIAGKEEWSQLPQNCCENFGLAVVDNVLTSVGGMKNGPSNALLSLNNKKQWCKIFPPMPTPRCSSACATTMQVLVVAGGLAKTNVYHKTVEVMIIDTKLWVVVPPLPQKYWLLSPAICGDTLYLAGGAAYSFPFKSVYSCYIPDLLQTTVLKSPAQRTTQNVWKTVSNLPVAGSTLVSFRGDLLAIGGMDDSDNPTSDVYKYDSPTNSWKLFCHMNNALTLRLAFTLPGDCLVVVGGIDCMNCRKTNHVEILK